MSVQFSEAEDRIIQPIRGTISNLSVYPIDMSSFLDLKNSTLDATGLPYESYPVVYNPITIAQYALAHWNLYLETNDEWYRKQFLAKAYWLVGNQVQVGEDTSCWPISFPHPQLSTKGSWLSATAQGCGISVLLRAYLLTSERVFLDVAHRAIRTFEQDILDGGVYAPVGEDGIFFEEVAVYPAAHSLCGCLFALLSLYDYIALTRSSHIEKLIQRCLTTLRSMVHEFDTGFWTYSDLLQRRLSSPAHLALQISLLEALSQYSAEDFCLIAALRWKQYERQFSSRLRYHIMSRYDSYSRKLWNWLQTLLFPRPQASSSLRVCVSVPAFPVMGGVLTVLEGLAQIMKGTWDIEYMAQHLGPARENYTIHQFGTRRMTPWYFPFVWLYVLSGVRKFISLMRHDAGYQVLLPQDGLFTGAMAGLAGKLTGTRVVCIDHGDLSLFTPRNKRILRTERINAVARKNWPWPVRFAAKQLLPLYWPSRYLLARIAAHFIDHYLIPGVAGDSIDEGCRHIGIPQSRITRYGSMIDIERHVVPTGLSKVMIREQKGIADDAIVAAIICRLSPEKGIDIALESISQALSTLSLEQRSKVRVIIAGDGPIRKQVEEDICRLGLQDYCSLWGELSSEEVIQLLGISDIFLYTSTRGACFAMAVLEAMASSCAVIASTEPLSNAVLLAEGRGIAVPAGDRGQTAQALIHLLTNAELCHHMGNLAREYITIHHSSALFRRNLLRTTYWSGLDELLNVNKNVEDVGRESGSPVCHPY